MKKKLLITFIFLLGFMFMPNTYAAEIPKEGVTYFLQYPDGTEDVKETYDEAIAASEEEKLIFSGETDENGQVVLEDIATEGTIRVVQEVPNGYSTDEREVIINLQENRKIEFKNTHGLINPKTGFSILAILLVLGLVIGGTVLAKKKKETLLIIPLLLLVGLVNVKADNDDLVIDVKDNLGRAQSGVTVKVYAKPTIDAAPAIKYNANGGHFFDGKTLMYVRIPSNGCSGDDFWDSLDYNFNNYLSENTYFAYRDGYSLTYYDDLPDIITNGVEILFHWEENSDAQLTTIHGNGGYYDFYGEKLNNISIYSYFDPLEFDSFSKTNTYFIGIDKSQNCDSYTSYGLLKPGQLVDDSYNDLYACWHDKPDGIYFNENLYLGTDDNCLFNYSHFDTETDYLTLVGKTNAAVSNIFGSIYYEYPEVEKLKNTDSSQVASLNKIEIVKNGQSIVLVNSNEISASDFNYEFVVTNSNKNTILQDYFAGMMNKYQNYQCPDYCDYYACGEYVDAK